VRNFSEVTPQRGFTLAGFGLAAVLALAAVALHAPGQVSMDTSMQLYEAYAGRSVSWNPPFMSALMRLYGGGELATALLVATNSLLTYAALSIGFASLLESDGHPRIAFARWRAVLGLLLFLNPILFIYVGIVWKDVLFASMLMLAAAASIAAAAAPNRRVSLAWGVVAMLVLPIAMKVRQQGVFMAPILAAAPLAGTLIGRSWTRAEKWRCATALIAVFFMTAIACSVFTDSMIHGAGDKSNSVGFSSIMNYDLVGGVVHSTTPTTQLPVRITEVQRAAARGYYTSTRIDGFQGSAVLSGWLDGFSPEERKQAWWAMWTHEPRALVEHRIKVFETVLDLNGIDRCLPVHIGIDGNEAYLREVGMATGRSARSLAIYDFAMKFKSWPLYRHWCYGLSLLAALVVIWRARLAPRIRAVTSIIALATLLFYASFLPTAISCDFRYLYTGVCLVTLIWMVVIMRAARSTVSSRAPSEWGEGHHA